MDTSRQWGQMVSQIQPDHVERYEFAKRYATGRILDAACGCGYGSSMLMEKGVVTGVDFSTDAVDWAEEYFPGPNYLLARIEDDPWGGRYETVVSLETIEHLKDPEKALEAFRRACVGKLIASVPNEVRYPFKAEDFQMDESPHFRHYKPEEFESLLKHAGFKVRGRHCQVSKLKPGVIEGVWGRYLIYVCE